MLGVDIDERETAALDDSRIFRIERTEVQKQVVLADRIGKISHVKGLSAHVLSLPAQNHGPMPVQIQRFYKADSIRAIHFLRRLDSRNLSDARLLYATALRNPAKIRGS